MGRLDNILKVGEIHTTHSWGDVEVLEYINCQKVLVKFSDGNTKWSATKEIRAGIVKNDFQPFLYGVGYYGQGEFSCKAEGQKVGSTLEYETWRGILRRCYDEKSFLKSPTYRGCTVCEEWHNFQNFASWYVQQKGFIERWDLDKDLLVFGNKVYSPSTCCLIPAEVNSLFSGANKPKRGSCPKGVHWDSTKKKYISQIHRGRICQDYLGSFNNPVDAFAAYKIAKEDYVKLIANKYKKDLPYQVYSNLINYEVKITD